jgi:hypothetical protein
MNLTVQVPNQKMRHIAAVLFILALCVPLIHATPAREEEENPPQWTYVPSPRTRGTWTILSTCIAALSTSTWSGLHLNIPKQKQSTVQSWKDWASIFSIKWALAAIIAPESLVGFAFSDWMHARKTEALIRKYGRGAMRSWDRTQVYFANMGGYVFCNFEVLADDTITDDTTIYQQEYAEEILAEALEIYNAFFEYGSMRLFKAMKIMFAFISFNFQAALDKIATGYGNSKKTRSDASNVSNSTETSPTIELHVTQVQEAETEAAGFVESPSNAGGDQGEEHTPSTSHAIPAPDRYDQVPTKRVNLYLNGTQILLAQCFGIIQDVPGMSSIDIEDKSKNTPFTKVLSALPLVALTYIVIYRAANGLLVSQLELSVAAYSICTILASACYWSKPQSVGVPRNIETTSQLRPLLFNDKRFLSAFSGTSFIQTNFYPPFGADRDIYLRGIARPISNDNIVGTFCPVAGATLHNADFASVISGTLFGALYCLCWNSPFPSTTEKYLWRTASVFVTAGLIPYALANAYFTKRFSATKTHTDIRQKIGLYTLLGCYIVARLFFIWEMFWSLFYQPEQTFHNKSGL